MQPVKIKPLNWERYVGQSETFQGVSGHTYPEEYEVVYRAETTFGSFVVTLTSTLDLETKQFSRDVGWSYCFDEYYDESGGDCKSLLAGKRHLEEIWRSRMLKCLEEC